MACKRLGRESPAGAVDAVICGCLCLLCRRAVTRAGSMLYVAAATQCYSKTGSTEARAPIGVPHASMQRG
jgi:hypothetical protein